MIIHSCLLPANEQDEQDEIEDARWLIRTVQDLKQRGEWDRGKEHDS